MIGIFGAQSEASIYCAAFVILLYVGVYLQAWLFAVYLSGLCRRAFFKKSCQWKWAPENKKKTQVSVLAKQSKTKMHQVKRSHCGPMEGKFVNISEITSACRLAHAIWKFTLPVSFYPITSVTEKKNLTTNYWQLKRVNKLLLHIAWQVCREARPKQPHTRFCLNKPRSTLVFAKLPLISPPSDSFNWCIFLFHFVLLTC